jgi:hypothetical protein
MEAGRRLRPERILPLDGVPVKDSPRQTVTLRLVNGDALTHDWAHAPPTQPAVAAAANIRQRTSASEPRQCRIARAQSKTPAWRRALLEACAMHARRAKKTSLTLTRTLMNRKAMNSVQSMVSQMALDFDRSVTSSEFELSND